MSSLLVVGSVAFDTIHNHLGSHERVIGGSATYASLAASQLAPVRLVGVVGKDFPREAVDMLRGHGIDTTGLEVANGETFHWEGRYSDDLTSRETIKTDLNVFADFNPKIPKAFRDSEFVMLGNIAPQLQLHVLDQIENPKLVIADTMNLWIDTALDPLKQVLKRVDILVIN
ncbi:MAG: sugar kinase, partial [Polyangiales bacterium]